jgi:xanthine dehydrogenase YagR molybdenum-binding subunit
MGSKAVDMKINRGTLHRDKPLKTRTYAMRQSVSGNGRSQGTFGDPSLKFSFHSYGAQFVEVTWQPEVARLRVSRVITIIDVGRMINPRAARNQIEGAVVMEIGMAMLEATEYDRRSGGPIITASPIIS